MAGTVAESQVEFVQIMIDSHAKGSMGSFSLVAPTGLGQA